MSRPFRRLAPRGAPVEGERVFQALFEVREADQPVGEVRLPRTVSAYGARERLWAWRQRILSSSRWHEVAGDVASRDLFERSSASVQTNSASTTSCTIHRACPPSPLTSGAHGRFAQDRLRSRTCAAEYSCRGRSSCRSSAFARRLSRHRVGNRIRRYLSAFKARAERRKLQLVEPLEYAPLPARLDADRSSFPADRTRSGRQA